MACRQKILIFGVFKACISKIAYTSLENSKNDNFLMISHQKSTENFFEGLRMYNIVQNLDGNDQGYQSHQLLTESDV